MSLELVKNKVRKNFKLRNLIRKILRVDVHEQRFMDLENKIIYQYIFDLEKRVRELEGKNNEVDFLPTTPNMATLGHPVSQPATFSQVKDPIYFDWCERLRLYPYPNRKTWEFVFIAQVLELNGMIRSGHSSLGFGVGKDPVVAYFAANGIDVLATDLNPDAAIEKGWAQTNQWSKNLEGLNEKGICTDSQLKKHVQMQHVDMNDIPADIGVYDFVWSACAFEHLGSIENGLNFVKNSMKHVKPGGIAVHTTEFNISSNDETINSGDTVLFRKKDFEKLASDLKNEGYEVELNFDIGNANFDKFYDIPPYSDFTHLKLKLDKYITTSFGVVVKKPLQ